MNIAHQVAGMLESNFDTDDLPTCANLIFEHMTENQQFKWIMNLQLRDSLGQRLIVQLGKA